MKKIVYSLILLFSLFSCEDFITEEPETHLNNQNSWNTEQDVAAAVYGLHQNFRKAFGNVVIINRDRGLPFDYLANPLAKTSQNKLESTWKLNSAHFVWADYYRVIANCHWILENMYRAKLSEDRQNFYETQAVFLLCYSYYYLICNWGDVPYIEKSEDIEPHARMPWVEVVDKIREILLKTIRVAPSLNELLDENGKPVTSKQFACKESLKALLAQIDCRTAFLGKRPELNEEGIRMITEVIESGLYGLLDNPEEVRDICLLGNSKEGIFELDYEDTPDDIHMDGSTMCIFAQKWPLIPNTTPSTKRTIARLTNKGFEELYSDPGDARRNAYFYKPEETKTYPVSVSQGAVYPIKWPHFVKYKDGKNAGKIRGYIGNLIIIRLAKLYLQRAVMRYRVGDVAGAISDLNTVRRRARVKDYAASEGDLLKAIVIEQIREHFGEGINERFNTIVENGLHREMLLGRFKTYTEEDIRKGCLFLPVPSGAFANNPYMRQTEIYIEYYGREK